MKFTAFNGSPVGEKSAAGRMLGVFLAGAARAGAETELYHLGDYSIGQCVQHDDMEKLLRAYQSEYKGKCGVCEFHKVCGGCRARAWSMDGDYMGEEPLCTYQPRKAKEAE